MNPNLVDLARETKNPDVGEEMPTILEVDIQALFHEYESPEPINLINHSTYIIDEINRMPEYTQDLILSKGK
jgi:hypothetical protein